jgi:hypothetical protein
LYHKEITRFIEERKKLLGYIFSLILFIIIILNINKINKYYAVPLRVIASYSVLFPALMLGKLLSDWWGKIRFVEYVALNAIVTLALHTYFIRLMEIVMHNPDFFDNKYWLKLAMAVAIVGLVIIPMYIINRYFPFVLGKGKWFERKN